MAKVRLASCGAEYFGRNEDSLYRASWRTIQRPVGNMALDVLRSSHGLNCISKAMLLPASDCTQLLLEVEGCWRLMHMTALERQTCDHTVIFCPTQQLIQVMATKELCSVRCLTWSNGPFTMLRCLRARRLWMWLFQTAVAAFISAVTQTKHVDWNNAGPSWIIAFGKFTGGSLWFEAPHGSKVHTLTKGRAEQGSTLQ